ncbi:uncharacterized protein VTP21DRAFT_894 [Calcarisporiella thermophila]|uniref:uncharacterized protein n=1 Tax=Calcarisporiella thermophila TaxID=911321 RepID=UPI003742550E
MDDSWCTFCNQRTNGSDLYCSATCRKMDGAHTTPSPQTLAAVKTLFSRNNARKFAYCREAPISTQATIRGYTHGYNPISPAY